MVGRPKIGIMTFYAAHNNGAALQAFALQQNLKKLGADTEFLRFYDQHNEKEEQKHSKLYNLFHRSQVLKNIIFHFKRTMKLRGKGKFTDDEYKIFQQDYLKTSVEPYYEYEDLHKANSLYHGFVTGSDMVWTPIGQNLPAYYLQFADRGKRFSYAPSLTGTISYTSEQHIEIQRYLNEFDIISCREEEGVKYIQDNLKIQVPHTLDPTLLFKKEEWCQELGITINKPSKPYILCYMFDELSHVQKKCIFEYAVLKGMEVRFIPMSMAQREYEVDHGYVQGYGPRTFVEMFLNASFIVTNTYHGLMFSLISENPFVLIHRNNGNKWKSNEGRMAYILNLLGQSKRFLYSNQEIPYSLFECDYSSILPILRIEREKSLSYLKIVVDQSRKNSLSTVGVKYSTIQDLSSKECTGCGLCLYECPLNAISMRMDSEGFIVPYVDRQICIECGKCVRKCPSINQVILRYPIESKACFSKDNLLFGSASGGAFISLARYFIEELQGVVYGAIFDDQMNCVHVEAIDMSEVVKMQNSKYVQSNIISILPVLKQRLLEGRYVLFTGTPCQVASVLAYVGNCSEKLVTVSLICHGVPSPGFWRTYLKSSYGENVSRYSFRNRKKTYKVGTSYQVEVLFPKNKRKIISPFKDPYYRTFLRGVSLRESCYYCKYARKERIGDLTIGDFDSEKLYSNFYPDESKSVVLINSNKGKNIWDKIAIKFKWIDINYNHEVKFNPQLRMPTIRPSLRKSIYLDLNAISWKSFVKKYIGC